MAEFDKMDAAQMAYTTPLSQRLVVLVFGRIVNGFVSRVLLRAKERGVVNGQQLHSLAAMFDTTQHGVVGLIRSGIKG